MEKGFQKTVSSPAAVVSLLTMMRFLLFTLFNSVCEHYFLIFYLLDLFHISSSTVISFWSNLTFSVFHSISQLHRSSVSC